MNTSLGFLPEHKREELQLITDLIVKKMQPDMVILFGSYARNTWAEEEKVEDGIRLIFKSDYDILLQRLVRFRNYHLCRGCAANSANKKE